MSIFGNRYPPYHTSLQSKCIIFSADKDRWANTITQAHFLGFSKHSVLPSQSFTSLHKRVKKTGLKLSIQKTKIMVSSRITSRQIDGEKVKALTDFIFLGSKGTADSDFRYEIKRLLLLGKKAMANLYSVLISRDITLSTKIHIVKAMIFPEVT